MSHALQQHLAKRKLGVATGIYSVCSAHPWVIQAAAKQAAEDGSLLLVEATSNQVNQFGGYTGMRPAAFREFVLGHLRASGLDVARLVLGGDHLGPNPWRKLPAAEAMSHAETMVAEYVQAGFTKIHLDASMSCVDDPAQLSDETVALRAVQLCQAAEAAYTSGDRPVYVIGTEVPVPGGATHTVHEIPATSTDAAAHTIDVHKRLFELGLPGVWPRVLALVVQPGVEFDHDAVVNYCAEKAAPLAQWALDQVDGIIFEAHSTDYQLPRPYLEMVRDGFAILKVGPALTFAMREALSNLEDIESQLFAKPQCSSLGRVIEETMLSAPEDWLQYYAGTPAEQKLLRLYSYSDRIRYYWGRPKISAAVATLVANLSSVSIPETMLSRYLPAQYWRVRAGEILADPESLILDHIRDALRPYAAACRAGY